MNITNISYTVEVPAGTYFLGDPCYAVPDDDWEDLLESCDYFDDKPIGQVKGHMVLAFNTMYGDGEYRDQYGNPYSVDAGVIGLTPEAYVDKTLDRETNLGKWVTFTRPVKCYSRGGTLVFGKYIIETDV